jgi:outer membrane protein TolC
MNFCSALPRWVFAVLGILCMVFVFATISPVTLAQQQTAPPAQESAKAPTIADLPPLPLSPIEKAQKDGTALQLSLKDLTKLALQNNLDIAIQDTNEQISQEKIRQSYGDYDPSLTATVNLNTQKSAITNYTSTSKDGYNQNDTARWNFQFKQNVKTGGNFSVQWNSSRQNNNSTYQSFNPQYGGVLTLTFTQPLLKNLRIDSTRSNIKLVNLDLKNTDSQFKQKVTDTMANIQSQYWSLVAAIRDYDIKRNSLRLAQINLRDNRKKVEVGTLAPIDVTDAEATMSSREVELISSEETLLSQENALRALVSSDRTSEIWSKVIVPTDTPEFKEYKVNMEEAITTALQNRPELEQSQITVNRLDINKTLAKNNRKWQLDVTGTYGNTGTAGPQSYRIDPNTGKPVLDPNGNLIPNTPPEFVGGILTAYKNVFTEGYYNWQVAINLNIPLKNRNIDAQIAQYDIQKRQELMRRKQTEQSIQVDVRNAVQQLETRRNQVRSAEAGRRFSKERLDGEEKRFQAGLSQNYLVLQRQDEFARAEYTYLQAQINYKKSIITLQKAMYTLLESNDFEIAKGSSESPAFQ